jgi:hypothetical protein
VDEHVLAAVIADDEAEALLRVEEFDDALAFADDLRGHSATAAAAKAAASAATAAIASATAAAVAASSAAAVTVATAAAAAEPAAIAIAAAAAIAAALLESAAELLKIVFAETFALIATAATAVSLAPSIETHIRPNLKSPPTPVTNALGPNGATGHGAQSTHAPFTSLHEK